MPGSPTSDDEGPSAPGRVGHLADLGRQAATVLRRDGWRVVAGELLARQSAALLAAAQPFHTAARPRDLRESSPPPAVVPAAVPGDRLTLNWVTNPPSEASGGMGTLMRAISLLEERGHTVRIYVLYKGSRRSLGRDRELARERFPHVHADVADLDRGMSPADAVVATSWPTAWAIRAAAPAAVPFYFVQDFEPWFYPASSNATLAEQTYRFGFHGVTAGPWLSQMLAREYGMVSDAFDLGVDLACYHPGGVESRSGVVFYARPDTARRGFELGMMALELFARRHPEVEIHTVGQPLRWRRPTFRFTDHGVLTPVELGDLYRRCAAGLVLSLSNLSLLPAELLACGCIPVMNDAEFTRVSCESPYARFSSPMPGSLADALADVVEHDPGAEVREEAARSVESHSWDEVGAQLDAAFRHGLERARPQASAPAPAMSRPGRP